VGGLVGDDTDGPPPQSHESDNDVLGIVSMDLEKIAVVSSPADELRDVIGFIGIGRHEIVEFGNFPIQRIFGLGHRRFLGIVRRQK